LPSERLLARYGTTNFSPLYRTAIDAYFSAQVAYQHQDYPAASAILNTFWKLYPPGGKVWLTAADEAESKARAYGVDFGTPPCYYALRMLTECLSWRMKRETPAAAGAAVRLAVVLVGHSNGIQPTTLQELQEHRGRQVRNDLRPELLANGNQVIQQASWLFREYMLAVTDGKLPVELHILSLPDLDIPMHVITAPYTQSGVSAELAPGALSQIWNAIDSEARLQFDWWWVFFPSHRPEGYPELAHTDFSNGGGTTVGPDGDSFATFGDDLSLIRKAPRYGKAPYTAEERIVYWAQLMQHEFFHHVFRVYPEFKLETKSHQWFDRSAWPTNFEGQLEADYYAEAVHKILKPLAVPPLYAKLRYATPASLVAKITPAMLVGSYRQSRVTNGWHEGRIEIGSAGMRWTNEAHKSWELIPEIRSLTLRTGPDNPYYQSEPDRGRAFRIVLRRDANGECIQEVAGFEFLGEFFSKF
jgi:hypothetical protein